ncbi:hypothetical protein N665_0178s0012 [Sinapis alba]|nr:hypothetical protein N665_0178s0012 [Sinapis alba]
MSINQHSTFVYIYSIKDVLREEEFNKIRETFLEPVIKLCERCLKLSGKIVDTILTKSIKTVKKHETWFYFGAQPLRFSIKEFHMVTGLKCSGEGEGPHKENERFKWDFLKGTHTLRHTSEDASDKRLCLAMLLLIETILLQKSVETTFPLDYVKKARDIDVLMTYPWGREAYELLLKSLKRSLDKNLDKKNYNLHGFPLAFHLWIIDSVPLLQSPFSTVIPFLEVQPSTPVFLCEKYIIVKAPSMEEVLAIENKENLKVTCILPSIPYDLDADVSMEDEANQDLDDMVNLSKRVDLYDAHEEIRRSLLFGNVEMGQASFSMRRIEDNFRIMNSRLMSLIEKDNKELKVCVSELEKQKKVTSDETLHNEDTSEPMTETVESRVQTLFEIGANVEIASEDQKNSKTRVQQKVSRDRIHPQPPHDEQRPGEIKCFELMDNVEAYYNDGFCSGRVQIILTNE